MTSLIIIRKTPIIECQRAPGSLSTQLKAGVMGQCCHVMRTDKPRKYENLIAHLQAKKKGIYNLENILENSVFVMKVKFALSAS